MKLIEQLSCVLNGKQFWRMHPERSLAALKQLDANDCVSFKAFYERFRGPLGSNVIGYQLLDIIEDKPSILTATEAVRSQFDLDSKWLVIADLLAHAALFYNTETDEVFDVDFEEGITLLMAGRLQPKWPSFEAFLQAFFQLDLG